MGRERARVGDTHENATTRVFSLSRTPLGEGVDEAENYPTTSQERGCKGSKCEIAITDTVLVGDAQKKKQKKRGSKKPKSEK